MNAKENLDLRRRLLHGLSTAIYGGLLSLQRALDIARFIGYYYRCRHSLPHNPQAAFLKRLDKTICEELNERRQI